MSEIDEQIESNIDKQIGTLLNRFDKLSYTDNDCMEEGKAAFDEIVDFLNYYPSNIAMLEKLFPALTKWCPAGTRRGLIQEANCSPDDPARLYVGNEAYINNELLIVELVLPPRPTETVEQLAAYLAEKDAIAKQFVAFSEKQGEFGGVIAIEIH